LRAQDFSSTFLVLLLAVATPAPTCHVIKCSLLQINFVIIEM
jgi:hypothetical protein